MSFFQLLGVLRASRWSILAMTLVAALVAFGFSSTLPKEYTAKARVLIDIGNSDPTQFSAVRRGEVESYFATEMRLVGDPGVMRQVVEQLGWAENPAVIDAWQSSTGGVGDIVAWAGNRILGNVGSRQLEDSSVVEIYYSAGDPEVAKQIAGLVRTAFIDNSLRLRVAAASRAAKWNRTEAERARVDLERAEAARIAFAKANNLTLNNSGVSTEMRTLSASIVARNRKVAPPPSPATPSASMLFTQRRLNDADMAVAMLSSRGPANPDFIMAQAQQQTLRAQLARETEANRRVAGAIAGSTREMRARADQEYIAARLKVLDQSAVYDRMLDLERAVAMKQTRYTAALARAAQFELVASAPSGMKVVGDVIGNDEPTFPNIPVITGIAAGFGLALGIAIALFTEMLSHRVRSSEDLAVSSNVPVLAVIVDSPPPRKRRRWWRSSARYPVLQPAE